MSQDSTINPQWGGRFSESTDDAVAHFTASVAFDRRMYRQDIQGSIAHARMLTAVGVPAAGVPAVFWGGHHESGIYSKSTLV